MTSRRIHILLVGVLAVVLVTALPAPRAAAQGQSIDIKTIIKKMDDLYRSESSHATITMHIVTAHWERTLSMEAWTEGQDRTFIRVHEPRKEAGVGTLRIDKEMWNYLPKVNKVIKVPPSMMSSSWMGSDFTNDDLVNEATLADDYDVVFTTVDNPDSSLVYVKATPHEDVPVVWSYYVIAITRDTYLPVWEKYYDDAGKPMRTAEFSDVRTFGGRTLPTVMTMMPLSEEKRGNRTEIRYDDIQFDIPLGDDVFTLRRLRSRE